MIVRLWHGRTNISKADEYAEFMKERAAPDYGSIDGLKKERGHILNIKY